MDMDMNKQHGHEHGHGQDVNLNFYWTSALGRYYANIYTCVYAYIGIIISSRLNVKDSANFIPRCRRQRSVLFCAVCDITEQMLALSGGQ
jgi:hypothetical protein